MAPGYTILTMYDNMSNGDFIFVLEIFIIIKYINSTHVVDMYGLIKLLPVLSPYLELLSKYFKRQ